MSSLHAEVTGRYDRAGDANHLLYTPLSRALTARETRCYTVDYEGDGDALTGFLARVLADPVSHELTTGDAPRFSGSSFILDYGMKGGALDLEKETILAHHRGDANPPFTIQNLRINRRLYVFDAAQAGDIQQLSDRFVRDIVNPAIHTWKVTVPATAPAPAVGEASTAAVVEPETVAAPAEPSTAAAESAASPEEETAPVTVPVAAEPESPAAESPAAESPAAESAVAPKEPQQNA